MHVLTPRPSTTQRPARKRLGVVAGFVLVSCAAPPPVDAPPLTPGGQGARSGQQATGPGETDRDYAAIDYEVVNIYPHDPEAYTQGLYFEDGFLFEGTGRYGTSSLRKVEIETGRVVQQVDLPDAFFGEGIASSGERIFQLTWLSETVFVYDKQSFTRRAQYSYAGEGWGLTSDGRSLILSDGSEYLRFIDPDGFAEERRLLVYDASGPVDQLNELEYARDLVYANVWRSDEVLVISPDSGEVIDRIDFSALLAGERPPDPEAVLNGIAYDPGRDRFFVTGKLWPSLFEVRLR